MDLTYTLVTKNQGDQTELERLRAKFSQQRQRNTNTAGITTKFYNEASAAYAKGDVSASQFVADLDLIGTGICSRLDKKEDQEAFKEARDTVIKETKLFRIKHEVQAMTVNPTCAGFGRSINAVYQHTGKGKNITEEAREIILEIKNISVAHLDEKDPVRKMRDNMVTRDYADFFNSVEDPGAKGPNGP